jgi:membrane protein DedA with SNARE-associated domain
MFGSQIVDWLGRYGYVGIAAGVMLESAGIPVPGETVLFAASFGAAHGLLALPAVIGAGAAAAVLGDNLGYWLGRRLGRAWADRHGRWLLLTHARLRKMDRFFDRFGPPAVVLARFIAGVRVVAAFSAGMARMQWWKFFLYNALGGVAWATATGISGYALGKGAKQLSELTGTWVTAVVTLVLGFAVGYWLWRRLMREREESDSPPD